MKRLLMDTAAALGVPLEDAAAEKFLRYMALLLEWNGKMNLTAITEEREVILRHFCDSLIAADGLSLSGRRAIDLGTGAGFPGLPIALAFPGVDMTLADSLQKRLRFLEEVQRELSLANVHLRHGRAEDLGREPGLREGFDLCFSRAVADLPVLLEYCLPLVRVGGVFVALKGPALPEELSRSQNALKSLGGKVTRAEERALPGTDYHTRLLWVEKIRPTPGKYPRPAGQIRKKPL